MIRRPIHFALVAPGAVVLLSTLVAIVMAWIGMKSLENSALRSAQDSADLSAQVLLARVEHFSPQQRSSFLKRAATDLKIRLEYWDSTNSLIFDEVPPHSEVSAVATAAAPQSEQRLRVSVRVEENAQESARFIASLSIFSIILIAAAATVAWALARDVHADVLYLRDLISKMAQEDGPPDADPIPVRSVDQVGLLTATFNTLLERFQAAERAYHQDLTQANAFDKDRAAFLAALSHELRTPLNAILGFADVLLNEIDGPIDDEARENLTLVRTSGDHLRCLIDDILALSALESGQFRLSRERLDLAHVANEVLTEAKVTAEQKGLDLRLISSNAESSPTAFADRRRMRQILGNVVSNAVKFTRQGFIELELQREAEHILITIRDTGPGIAAEDLEKIFQEFEQSGNENTQRQGTGLGLSITKRLTEMHGGDVMVASTLGVGSTFSIRIPIEERPERVALDIIPRGQVEPTIHQA